MKFEITNRPSNSAKFFVTPLKEIMLSMSDKYAKIKYDDRQIKTVPKIKFKFLFGFINCHKKGTPNNKIR